MSTYFQGQKVIKRLWIRGVQIELHQYINGIRHRYLSIYGKDNQVVSVTQWFFIGYALFSFLLWFSLITSWLSVTFAAPKYCYIACARHCPFICLDFNIFSMPNLIHFMVLNMFFNVNAAYMTWWITCLLYIIANVRISHNRGELQQVGCKFGSRRPHERLL